MTAPRRAVPGSEPDGRIEDGPLDATARVLSRRVGLRLDPSARGRLWRCVLDEARARQLDPAAYVERLDHEPTWLQDLLNRVTVQETSFFRDRHQFEAFRQLAPKLAAPVTIWSAACSNGQEPYSLAMVLAEARGDDWRIIATDVSTKALDRAREGRYSSRELAGVDPARRDRHFVAVDDRWEVGKPLRDRVEVRHHNLAADPPPFPQGSCEVIFCRNVLIYFGHDELVAFINRLADWMAPSSWLFLGYSESLWQVSDRFQLTHLGDAFVYRRQDRRPRAAAPMPPTAPSAPEPEPGVGPRERSARSRGEAKPAATGERRRQPRPPLPASQPTVPDLLAVGEAALERKDYPAAVAAFRKCTYVDPDQPIAHLHLGLALEAAGDDRAARRAYAASRSALERSDVAAVETVLEGYAVDDLVQLLERKLKARADR